MDLHAIKKEKIMSFLKRIFIFIALIYCGVIAFMYVFQRRFMYRPQRQIYTPYKDLAPENLKPVSITTSDGLILTSWFAEPQKKKDGSYFPTVFYFHGNTGIVANAAHKMIPLAKAGFGIFMTEYRGYGGNPGKPSEQGLIKDAVASRAYVLNVLGHDAPLVYYGMSMGTGVANALAELFPPSALIQEAGFTTFCDAAKERYPFFPVHLLMKDTFDTARRIQKLKSPLLVLHGEKDKTVPVIQAKKVFELAQSDKKDIILYPQGQHIDLYDFGSSTDVTVWLKNLFSDEKE